MSTPTTDSPYGGTVPPTLLPPVTVVQAPTTTTTVQRDNDLAFTGSDLVPDLALFGGLAVVIGVLLTLGSRRRRAATA